MVARKTDIYLFALHVFVVNFSMQCDNQQAIPLESKKPYSMVHVCQTEMCTNKTNEDTRCHHTCIAL